MKLYYIAGLMATSLLVATPAPAQTIEGVEGIIMLLATTFGGAMLYQPSNDKLDEGPSNTFIGFQPQIECSARINFESIVPGGTGLPCTPDQQYPPGGAGMQKLTDLTADECRVKTNLGSTALGNTIVTSMQTGDRTTTGVPFGVSPPGLTAGGVCAPTSKGALPDSFVGWLLGRYIIIAVNVLSDTQCAYLVNMCTGACSCGPFNHP